MDPKVIASTFALVFVAELGDKTQLTVLSLAAGAQSRWSVFVGAALALVASSLAAVVLADQIARRVSPRWTQGAAGVILVVMGVIYLVAAYRGRS